MKLLKSIIISLFLMVMLGSGVMAQNLYSQYYDFSTNSWKSIPTTNTVVQDVNPEDIQIGEQTYNCYNIVLPKESGKDYYYLLAPSTTAKGLVLTSPYNKNGEDGSTPAPQPFDLGDINIVVPNNSTFTLNYVHRNGNGFGVYIGSIFSQQNQNLPVNINFVPGGNNQSGTFNPNNVGTINITSNLTDIINDLNLGEGLAEDIVKDKIELNFNSGINFNIVNDIENTDTVTASDNPNELELPITITNYAGLSLQNVGLSNLTSFDNESTGTLTLNANCTLQTATGGSVTNDGTIKISGDGILNIGQTEDSTASLENNNIISVSDDGILNCYGTLTNNSNAQLNIAADADVTMYANSTLDNNGTITVTPPAS